MASTDDWMPAVTGEAMRRLLVHAEKVELANTDECTVRAFFMAAAHDLLGAGFPRQGVTTTYTSGAPTRPTPLIAHDLRQSRMFSATALRQTSP